MLKKLTAMILAMAMVFALAACGGTSAASSSENGGESTEAESSGESAAAEGSRVLKVGACAPLTGESAKAGQEFRDACELAMEEAGYTAGSYTIDLEFVDVTSDPEKGSLALEQAIVQKGLQVILFNWNSSVAVALMDVAAKYQIPYFFGLGATDVIVEKWKENPDTYSYYMAKGWPSPSTLTVAYSEFVEDIVADGRFAPRNKKIGIMADDSDFGRSFGESMKTNFGAHGWEIAVEDYVALSATDAYAMLAKMKEADCSIILGSLTVPAMSAAFIKQAEELGVKAFIFCDGYVEDSTWYERTGPASDYVCVCNPKLTKDSALEFKAKFEDKYGYSPSASVGGQIYDYSRFFLKIAAETESRYDGVVDTDTLYKFGTEVLMKGDFPYTDSILQDCIVYQDGELDPVIGQGYYVFPMTQCFEGQINVVWPDSMKETDLVVPEKFQ